MPSPRKGCLAKVRLDLRKVSYRHLLTDLRPARHLRTTLGAPLLVTGYSHCVGLLVAAIGAHAVATGTGGLSTAHPARPTPATTASATTAAASTSTTSTHLTHLLVENISHYPRRHSPPSEQGGVSHRSSRPQQVRPAGRTVCPLNMTGAESSLSNDELPQCGQVTVLLPRTSTSNVALQVRQRYS